MNYPYFRSNGAVTSLSFLSAFLAINPNHMMLKSKMLPFFMIPFILYIYEWNEWKSVYVNEISINIYYYIIIYL